LPFKVAKARLRKEAFGQMGANPTVLLSDTAAPSRGSQRWQWLQNWRVCRLRWQYRQQQMHWQQRLGHVAVGLLVVFGLLTSGALLLPFNTQHSQLVATVWYVPTLSGVHEQTPSKVTTRLVLVKNKAGQIPGSMPTSFYEIAEISEPASLAINALEEPETAIPPEYMIEGVPAGKQERNLNCEFQSAADLARFYGQPISWEEIFLRVGHDPNGDPNAGFVGDSFEDPPGSLYPNGYGVYAQPLAEGLRELGLNAQAFIHRDADWLKREISSGRPVIVWATYGMAPGQMEGWHTRDGKAWIKAVRNEHTYMVVGYDGEGVYVNDPFDGQQYHYGWEAFLTSWGYLDHMAVSIQPPFLLRGSEIEPRG